jgi:hypothetical protein
VHDPTDIYSDFGREGHILAFSIVESGPVCSDFDLRTFRARDACLGPAIDWRYFLGS